MVYGCALLRNHVNCRPFSTVDAPRNERLAEPAVEPHNLDHNDNGWHLRVDEQHQCNARASGHLGHHCETRYASNPDKATGMPFITQSADVHRDYPQLLEPGSPPWRLQNRSNTMRLAQKHWEVGAFTWALAISTLADGALQSPRRRHDLTHTPTRLCVQDHRASGIDKHLAAAQRHPRVQDTVRVPKLATAT